MEPHFLLRIPGGKTHQLRGSSDENLRHRKRAHTRGQGHPRVWVSSLRSGAFLDEMSTLHLTTAWLDPGTAERSWGTSLGGHAWRYLCILWVAVQESHADTEHTRGGAGQWHPRVPCWNCPLCGNSDVPRRKTSSVVSGSVTKCSSISYSVSWA